MTDGRGVRKVSKSWSYPQVSEKHFQSVSYISRSPRGWGRGAPVSRLPRGGVLKSGPSGTHGAPGAGRGGPPGRAVANGGRLVRGGPPAKPGRPGGVRLSVRESVISPGPRRYFPKYFLSVSYISRSSRSWGRGAPVSRVPQGGVLKSGYQGPRGAPGGLWIPSSTWVPTPFPFPFSRRQAVPWSRPTSGYVWKRPRRSV